MGGEGEAERQQDGIAKLEATGRHEDRHQVRPDRAAISASFVHP